MTGIVLSVTPRGESIESCNSDKGKGKDFSICQRGKPNSQFGGAVSPFCFGEFTLYEGRSSYNIMQVHISNYFQELKNDMEATYYGFYFMEFAEYYTREQNDETEMLKLLYQTFRALTKKNIPNELIRCIYELKAVYINGEGPQVFQCVKCGNGEAPFIFSVRQGGIICKNCIKEVNDAVEIDTSTLYAMQYIAGSSIEKLLYFTVLGKRIEKIEKNCIGIPFLLCGENF